MARRRGRGRHRRHSFKIPVITIAILGGQIGTAWSRAGGNGMKTLKELGIMYTGFDPEAGAFNWPRLLEGYGPWVAKGLLTKVVRSIGHPRIPFGLPISIS